MGSIHNELRRAGFIQDAVQRALGMQEGNGVERVSETLTPILDLFARPEWAFLRRERLWGIGGIPLAANVAGIARFQLSLPAGCNMISVVLGLRVLEQTATSFNLLTDTGAFIAGGLAPCSSRDMRWPINAGGTARPARTLQTVDNTAAGNSGIFLDEQVAILNGEEADFRVLPIVLVPGAYIQVQSSSVNHQQRYNAWGYERLAVPGELA